MKGYFERYAYQTLDSDEFVSYLTDKAPAIAAQINFDAWLHSPGACPVLAPLDLSLVTAASDLAKEWKAVCTGFEAGERETALREKFGEGAPSVREWDANQKQLFLTEMLTLITDGKSGDGSPWWDVISCAAFADMYRILMLKAIAKFGSSGAA